jgi:hypothetical protein
MPAPITMPTVIIVASNTLSVGAGVSLISPSLPSPARRGRVEAGV